MHRPVRERSADISVAVVTVVVLPVCSESPTFGVSRDGSRVLVVPVTLLWPGTAHSRVLQWTPIDRLCIVAGQRLDEMFSIREYRAAFDRDRVVMTAMNAVFVLTELESYLLVIGGDP
jgi:hypothetical protein